MTLLLRKLGLLCFTIQQYTCF